MTLHVASMQRIRPRQEHGSLAAARLPSTLSAADPAAVQAAARALGMKSVGPDQYAHPTDGSWVAVEGRSIARGVGGERFERSAVDLATLPVAPPGALGAVAARQIAPGQDPSRVKAQLARQGFVEVLPTYFVHPDKSWVALVKDLGVLRGVGKQRLDPTDVAKPGAPGAGLPTIPRAADEVTAFKRVAPKLEDGFYACAQLGYLSPYNRASDAATFKQLGFQETAPGLFTHKDGSWVAYTSGGRIERGAGLTTFQSVPVSPQRQQQKSPGAQHLAFAVANPRLARLTPKQVLDGHPALKEAGFQQVRPGLHRHDDGSFIAASGDAVHVGTKQTLLTGFPTIGSLNGKPPTLKAIEQCVALWDLPADVEKARPKLLAQGFVEPRPGLFQDAANKRWILFEDKSVHVGVGASVYDGIPSPARLPRKPSGSAHAFLAIAKTADLTAKTADAATLGALGFADKGGGLFTHKDGSWVLVDGRTIERGHDGVVFSDVPQPPKPGEYEVFTRKPPGTWAAWRKRFAVARVPFFQGQFTAAEAKKILTHLGFQATGQGTWSHPDGSKLVLRGDPPYFSSSSFQKWSFAEFPYQNYPDYDTSLRLTDKWQAWVQRGGSPPY